MASRSAAAIDCCGCNSKSRSATFSFTASNSASREGRFLPPSTSAVSAASPSFASPAMPTVGAAFRPTSSASMSSWIRGTPAGSPIQTAGSSSRVPTARIASARGSRKRVLSPAWPR